MKPEQAGPVESTVQKSALKSNFTKHNDYDYDSTRLDSEILK